MLLWPKATVLIFSACFVRDDMCWQLVAFLVVWLLCLLTPARPVTFCILLLFVFLITHFCLSLLWPIIVKCYWSLIHEFGDTLFRCMCLCRTETPHRILTFLGAQLPERLMVWQGCGLSVWHLARKVRLAGFANLRAQPGTLKDEWRRALGTGHLSPEDSMKGTRREGSFTGDPERYVK